jgi:hypothetical protein
MTSTDPSRSSAGTRMLRRACDEISRRHAETGDERSCIWVFLDHRRWSIPGSKRAFGDEANRIEIVDPFGGREPIRVNHAFVRGPAQVAFAPTVLLDSNLVGYLQEFVNTTGEKNPGRRRAILEFLDWAYVANFDFNPLFYFMEALAKDERGAFPPHAERAQTSILRLHTADVESFWHNGTVKTDPRLLAPYQDEYGKRTLEEVAAAQARTLLADGRGWLSAANPLLDLSYAVLLKMALVNQRRGLSVLDKDAELRQFVAERIGISMGREQMLGLLHFTGQTGKFLRLEKSMGMERIRRAVMGSVWDLFLLRLPEFLLSWVQHPATLVGFPCTTEKAVQKIGRSLKLEMISDLAGQNGPLTVLNSEPAELEGMIAPDVIDALIERDRQSRADAERAVLDASVRALRTEPAVLAREMEDEVRNELGLP